MIELICILLIVQNLVVIYLLMKEREKLIKYLALKFDLSIDKVEKIEKQPLDSVVLDEVIEAEIEKRKKTQILNELEEL